MTSVALIETVRVRGGAAPLWYLHLRRLVASCRALGIPFPREMVVPEGGPDRIHRLEVSARGTQISVRDVADAASVRILTSPVAHQPYPHKTTKRAVFDTAQAGARRAGADDGILLASGLVAEGSIWGMFWWEGERLCAPPLDLGILPGVARARLEEITGGVAERRATPSDLGGYPVFLANAARGIAMVEAWDGNPVPTHPHTARLKERFWA